MKIMKRYALGEREPKATLRLEVVVINLGNLASARGTGNNSSAAKVENSWFCSNIKTVALDSPLSLDRFTIVMSGWLHSILEDKVLF